MATDWRLPLSAHLAQQLDVNGLAHELVSRIGARAEAPAWVVLGDECWAWADGEVARGPLDGDVARRAALRSDDGPVFDGDVAVIPIGARGSVQIGFDPGRPDRESVTADVAELGPLVASLVDGVEMYQALDLVVQQEMTAAVLREEHIKLLMDSMTDGLVVCALDGTVTGTQSRAARDLLGDCEGAKIWDVLAPDDPAMTRLAYEQVAENLLPFEVSASLLPTELERDDRVLRMSYGEVVEGGEFVYVMLLVRDATAEVAAERADAERRQLTNIVSHLIADHGGFVSFVHEVEELLASLREDQDEATLARRLHTIKGNAAIFGFDSVASRCHALEERIQSGATFASADREDLVASWREALGGISAMLDGHGGGDLLLLRGEYDRLCIALERAGTPEPVRELVASWENDAVRDLLVTPSRQAERLARSLGKRVQVVVEHNDARLPNAGAKMLFRNLVHLVRNAIDHGIETPEERARCGKAPVGRLLITTLREASAFTVSVQDDGRGIDWDRVRALASERGLPASTPEELFAALASDGLSTRAQASEISGRGVGLGAVRQACEGLGGTFDIQSEPGSGTTFRCVIPV